MVRRKGRKPPPTVRRIVIGGVLRGVMIAVFVASGYGARAAHDRPKDIISATEDEVLVTLKHALSGWKLIMWKISKDLGEVQATYRRNPEQ